MTKVSLSGVVKNINSRTSIYSPIIEAIVNSLESIEARGGVDGQVTITLIRDPQGVLDFSESKILPKIVGIEVTDNGIGFNKTNRDSFDTLYSELKVENGGKGFGRFIFRKYFDDITIDSTYQEDGIYLERKFKFGGNTKIIVDESTQRARIKSYQTTLHLGKIKDDIDKKITTIARILAQKLLIYFITDGYHCPKIVLEDSLDYSTKIVLNDYVGLDEQREIIKLHDKEFSMGEGNEKQTFTIKIFKIYFPSSQKSKISLAAHKREVTENTIEKYIPEFAENFYEETPEKTRKDYLIKSYVLGKYLDDNVSLERNSFNFPREFPDSIYRYSQCDIEREAAKLTREVSALKDQLNSRKKKKIEKIKNYINNKAPWYKSIEEKVELDDLAYNPTDQMIDSVLHKTNYLIETKTNEKIQNVLLEDDASIDSKVNEIISEISEVKSSQLTHYVALRKTILAVLEKCLEKMENGKFEKEDTLHSIIFPTKSDSMKTKYAEHNLWILDERLNFTEYISSDKEMNGKNTERVDILVFGQKFAFRTGNDAGNPITIFEFKKPQRDDFANGSSDEDPLEQVVRYATDLKEGKYKTPKGRDIAISSSTPFYAYIVCDITNKVRKWLENKDFHIMADGMGWYLWHSNKNLYIEVLSWEKILNDSKMRNLVFFKKLGIE